MNYRHVYMLIIKHAKSEEQLGIRKKHNGIYYESHHILPKSLFPLWAKRKSNFVLLTAREHFFVHKLLTKIFPSKSIEAALWLMFNTRKHKDSSREYEKIKISMIEYFNENKKKNQNPFPGARAAGKVNKELRSLPIYVPELNKTFVSQKEAAKYFNTSETRLGAQIKRTLDGKLYRGQYHIIRVSKEG